MGTVVSQGQGGVLGLKVLLIHSLTSELTVQPDNVLQTDDTVDKETRDSVDT